MVLLPHLPVSKVLRLGIWPLGGRFFLIIVSLLTLLSLKWSWMIVFFHLMGGFFEGGVTLVGVSLVYMIWRVVGVSRSRFAVGVVPMLIVCSGSFLIAPTLCSSLLSYERMPPFDAGSILAGDECLVRIRQEVLSFERSPSVSTTPSNNGVIFFRTVCFYLLAQTTSSSCKHLY